MRVASESTNSDGTRTCARCSTAFIYRSPWDVFCPPCAPLAHQEAASKDQERRKERRREVARSTGDQFARVRLIPNEGPLAMAIAKAISDNPEWRKQIRRAAGLLVEWAQHEERSPDSLVPADEEPIRTWIEGKFRHPRQVMSEIRKVLRKLPDSLDCAP